jgi:hypothetical protein
MIYRRLADLVVVVHVLLVVFSLCGAFLSWQYVWVALLHIPFAVWVTASFIAGWTCPLTPLENHLRKAGGAQGYECGFVDHYFTPLVTQPRAVNEPTPPSTRQGEIAIGVLFGGVSFALHAVNFAQYRDAITRLTG